MKKSFSGELIKEKIYSLQINLQCSTMYSRLEVLDISIYKTYQLAIYQHFLKTPISKCTRLACLLSFASFFMLHWMNFSSLLHTIQTWTFEFCTVVQGQVLKDFKFLVSCYQGQADSASLKVVSSRGNHFPLHWLDQCLNLFIQKPENDQVPNPKALITAFLKWNWVYFQCTALPNFSNALTTSKKDQK